MTKKYIEAVYYGIIKETLQNYNEAELVSAEVVIKECEGVLCVGLNLVWHTPDDFPELDGTWPRDYEGVLTWTPTKPLTYKQLIKVSKIWKDLVNNP